MSWSIRFIEVEQQVSRRCTGDLATRSTSSKKHIERVKEPKWKSSTPAHGATSHGSTK